MIRVLLCVQNPLITIY